MRMTRSEFLAWPHKAITLLGMSGVGKTTLAYKLPSDKWFHYSGDYRIGTKYLAEPILDNIKRQAMKVDFLRDLLRNDSIYISSNITVHNLQPVATFLGKIGRTDLGGLPVGEFKKRQRLHRAIQRLRLPTRGGWIESRRCCDRRSLRCAQRRQSGGIGGQIRRQPRQPIAEAELQAMIGALHHRGPDGSAVRTFGSSSNSCGGACRPNSVSVW